MCVYYHVAILERQTFTQEGIHIQAMQSETVLYFYIIIAENETHMPTSMLACAHVYLIGLHCLVIDLFKMLVPCTLFIR